jgi:hypothetical protein
VQPFASTLRPGRVARDELRRDSRLQAASQGLLDVDARPGAQPAAGLPVSGPLQLGKVPLHFQACEVAQLGRGDRIRLDVPAQILEVSGARPATLDDARGDVLHPMVDPGREPLLGAGGCAVVLLLHFGEALFGPPFDPVFPERDLVGDRILCCEFLPLFDGLSGSRIGAEPEADGVTVLPARLDEDAGHYAAAGLDCCASQATNAARGMRTILCRRAQGISPSLQRR